MQPGLICLMLGYVLSQFYRSFLAVLAPVLTADLGMGPEVLSQASGIWFLVFAACQLPFGLALDRIGPRRTSSVMLALGGGGGTVLLATAQGPGMVTLAMGLIGAGCAPVLIAGYFIVARRYPPRLFATIAATMVGVGMIGDLGASLPLAWAAETLGWRPALGLVAVLTLAVAAAIALVVEDPPLAARTPGGESGVLSLLRPGPLWFVLAMLSVGYGPIGATRGLWAGPYLSSVHGLDPTGIAMVTTLMGVTMAAGNFAYGPLDRVFRTRKWVVLGGVLVTAACFGALAGSSGTSLWRDGALLAAVGFFGMSYPVQMAHGRAFFPAHLTGRGVALLNLFSVGGVGLFQMASGRVFAATISRGPGVAYDTIFGFFAAALVAGAAVYLFSTDRID